jgi:hypothetical protein
MTANIPHYQRRDAPRFGRGLALIVAPDGREELWALNLWAADVVPCTRCGAVVTRHYRPAVTFGRGASGPHLCRPCVEGAAAPRGEV